MIPLDLIRDFVNNEIPFIESKQTLHDVFFLILKDHGIMYQKLRSGWIDYDSRQLKLFNGDHSF